MIKEQTKCQMSRHNKNQKRKRMRRRVVFLLISCFTLFILGQAFTNVLQQVRDIIVKDMAGTNISYATTTANNEKVNDLMQSKNDWNLILTNPWNCIPEDFKVDLIQLKNGQSVDKRIYPELQEMLDDARAEGLSPIICSSFRTMEKQQSLFNNQVNKYISQGYTEEQAKLEAGKWVAVPGTSEHQAGLAVDIVSSNNQVLNEGQEETLEQQWLIKNSYKYGFILRYPSDKSEITGIGYEPWHYRYVGKKVANEIKEKGICLEEYLIALDKKTI